MHRESFKEVYIALGLLAGAVATGVVGYMIIEDFDFTDALFMTIITIATVGFKEVHPLTTPGMYFTVFLIVSSFGIFAYAVSTFTRYVIGGALGHYYKNRKVKNKIQQLKEHVIVCGFGRNGQQAVSELIAHGVPIVVVERNEAVMDEILKHPNLLYVYGDATEDEILESCRAQQAKALITTLPDDADNLFVVLSARELNPKMTIISRANHENSDVKIKRAGATNVIMPDRIGGQRMAKLVAQPDVVEFLDFIMLQSSENVTLEEVSCSKLNSCFEGRSIRELDIRNESGANIIGLKRADSSFLINPLPEIQLSSLDKLFVLGTQSQVEALQQIMVDGEK